MKNQLLTQINKQISRIEEKNNDKVLGIKNNEVVLSEAIINYLPTIKNLDKVENVRDLHYLKIALEELTNTYREVLEDEENKQFLKTGKNFDDEELRNQFAKQDLKKKFPGLDLERYLYLVNNPLMSIKNFDEVTIYYDEYWVKKNLIAINQMIFNEMDLYVLNIGKEGSGKSCWSSQQILYYYTFLKEVGLVDYEYDPKKMFFVDLESFLQNHEVQKKNDYFRIECMDEGNELGRMNFREENNQQFKYEMRTERKMLRIILLNMQQIGELDTSISLSRVNFIYNCLMRSNKKTGTLTKGFIDMYIIPRGNEVYSEKHKKILTRQDILNTFAVKLDKKKDYYVNLPKDYVVKNFKFENLWGFDKEEYDEHVKDSMQERRFQKKMKLTDNQAYILVTKLEHFSKLGTFDLAEKSDKKMYNTTYKFFEKLKKYFDSNPEKFSAMRQYYAKNVENYIKE